MSIGQHSERFEIEPPRAAAAPRQQGRRGCLWIAIPAGCVVILLVCGGFGAALFFGVMAALKNSEPYQRAIDLAQANPEVRQTLGEEITPGWAISGSINVSNDQGDVDMTIPLSGSQGSGQVRIRGRKANGRWNYDQIEFTDSAGNTIDLNEPTD